MEPKTWGYLSHGAHQLNSLDGRNYAVMACLAMTDHSNCIENYCPDSAYVCSYYNPWSATSYGM